MREFLCSLEKLCKTHQLTHALVDSGYRLLQVKEIERENQQI